MRKATFKRIPARVDGSAFVTLTVEHEQFRPGIVTVRAKGARRAYALSLSLVAEMVAWRCAKIDAEAAVKAKARPRLRA